MTDTVEGTYWTLGSAPQVANGRSGGAGLDVRNQLRDAILRGDLRPGEAVTSVEVAERFGVSRTPAREALRMLQEEGYLRGEANQRLRVMEWSPDELEAVFAGRILLTVLCTRLTVPTMTDTDLDRMGRLLQTMHRTREAGDSQAWRDADIAFHSMHLQGAPLSLREDLSRLFERATMFRAIWLQNRDHGLHFATDDHPLIYDACLAGDAEEAALAAARHLTRVAMTLMLEMSPGRDIPAVREALRLAGAAPDDTQPSPERRTPRRAR